MRIVLLVLWGIAAAASQAVAGEVLAGAASKVAVTVYRAPNRARGALQLDDLEGFALISETREVRLPAGESRLRFEGVANGIDAASALVSGMPATLIEKNRDARLLDPSALARAAAGRLLQLVRTDRATGRVVRTDVDMLSASESGVVLKSAAGVEAYHCDGLSETFAYSTAAGLSAAPALSVRVKTERAVSAQVTLSYLSRGFDWSAQYSAHVSADGTHIDLGAWVTLANGNDVGFGAATTKVVAGRVNRDTGNVEPVDIGPRVFAACWPQQTTSDLPIQRPVPKPAAPSDKLMLMRALPVAAATADTRQEVVVAQTVALEQLGDLKLYSVPERTTIAARQSKQVRLLDRVAIPVSAVYSAELHDGLDGEASVPLKLRLRTKNSSANHLGLALPSGSIALFEGARAESVLLSESPLRDIAVDEAVEIDAGSSADVRIRIVEDSNDSAPEPRRSRPRRPRHAGQSEDTIARVRVDITNARTSAARVELKINLDDGERMLDADHPLGRRDGQPAFILSVPSGRTETLRFALESP